jgi:hypothetical protein
MQRWATKRSSAEWRKGDGEDSAMTVPFVQEVTLMLVHDCLLDEARGQRRRVYSPI